MNKLFQIIKKWVDRQIKFNHDYADEFHRPYTISHE